MNVNAKNFAVIGVGGYIAPRHLKAIYETGNRVVSALDPNDSVGFLDNFDHKIAFFTEPERFDRHLEKLRQGDSQDHVHYVSVCSPNYLHDSHIRMALRAGADVICEKPLVINPWNIDLLKNVEQSTGRQVNVVLQLRVHPRLIELRNQLKQMPSSTQHQVTLTYITARGQWYDYSWKGDPKKSGGMAVNIGIHFFDLLGWLFGQHGDVHMYLADERRMSGYIEYQNAQVKWLLSVNKEDLPFTPQPGKLSTYRSITIDGVEVEFTDGFTDLHTLIYQNVLKGEGFGVDEIRQATELTYTIRNTPVLRPDELAHPFVLSQGIHS